MPNSSSRLPPIPEPAKWGRRRILLVALVISLLVHLAGGIIFDAFKHAFPSKNATEEALITQKITISTPRPTAKPTPRPTPTPVPTPTPAPTPTPQFLKQSAKTTHPAPHPRVRPTPAVAPPPQAAPPRPHELAVEKPHAAHQLPPHKLSKIAQAIALAESQSTSTIASAQHDVAQTAAPTSGYYGDGHTATMKKYGGGFGSAFSTEGTSDGECVFVDPIDRGDYTYVLLTNCRTTYSDGYSEVVNIPWRYKFPKGHVPKPGVRFARQGPPEDYVLPRAFEMSREVCTYFGPECDALRKREREQGLPDYGPP